MSTATGRLAEKAAAEYFAGNYGYKILSRNWRTRICEIDIVALTKSGLLGRLKTVHFIEVKYRRNSSQGDGFDYITDKKLQQMAKAAGLWVHENNWTGDYQLDVVAVTGQPDEWEFDARLNVSV